MGRIHLSPPHMTEVERELLLEAFDANWVAPAGPDLDAFEREFASRVGADHAVALASGTAGLHLALLIAGVQPDDVVIVPSFTFAATANAACYIGAEPWFKPAPFAIFAIRCMRASCHLLISVSRST